MTRQVDARLDSAPPLILAQDSSPPTFSQRIAHLPELHSAPSDGRTTLLSSYKSGNSFDRRTEHLLPTLTLSLSLELSRSGSGRGIGGCMLCHPCVRRMENDALLNSRIWLTGEAMGTRTAVNRQSPTWPFQCYTVSVGLLKKIVLQARSHFWSSRGSGVKCIFSYFGCSSHFAARTRIITSPKPCCIAPDEPNTNLMLMPSNQGE